MPTVEANGIEICYETFGSPDDPTVLLVMGLGAQMIAWPDDFCELLASRGFHVVRFDNRDVGLSTKFVDAGMPDIGKAMAGEAAIYTLDDMADDAVALIEELGIEAAHIVGASMGGMIAQLVAIRHPNKTLSLTSIMSNPGGPNVVPPTPEAMAVLMAPRPQNREEVIELAVKARGVIGGKGFPMDTDRIRELAGRSYDRCYHPEGMMRQLAAIMASPGRIEALGALDVPTCVVHGTDDTLVPPENGRLTAAAIPGSELVEIAGMGHDLPQGAWDEIVAAIERTAARTGAAATS